MNVYYNYFQNIDTTLTSLYQILNKSLLMNYLVTICTQISKYGCSFLDELTTHFVETSLFLTV